ncbi:MAG TPA: TolC family protein [Longimicrobiaceae bacterium]
MRRLAMATAVLAALALPGVEGLLAQEVAPTDTVELSLPEALNRGLDESEEIRLARSQVVLAGAQVSSARSAVLPQVNGNFGYTRTLASVFSGAAAPAIPDSLRFDPDPSLPLEERVEYLEDRTPIAALGALGGLFSDLPFGREHAYTASLSGSQLLFSGGRAGAALNIARDFRAAAEAGLSQQEAQIQLQIRSAYYQALLAQEMATIAEAALEQAEAFYRQEQLRLRAGQASELEAMRAEVARDNLQPQVVQGRNAADLAALNLKRLVNLPLSQPLRLTTPLAVPAIQDSAAVRPSDELVQAQRMAVEAVEHQVEIRRQQVRIARGAYLPNVSLQTAYARQLYPSGPFSFSDPWATDWTVSLNMSLPLFSGFRRGADLHQARVQLEQSRLQLAQLEESVQLQYEQAYGEKRRALSAMQARQRTVDVAQRVYDLTVLRYDRGLATQLEVSDARLSLLQARTNLAQAIADFYTADSGQVASLGLGAASEAASAAGQAAQPQPTQPQGGAAGGVQGGAGTMGVR